MMDDICSFFVNKILSKVNLIILFVLKNSSFNCILDYLFKHVLIFFHQISYIGIQRIFSIGIGHDEYQPTNNHSQGNSWCVVFSHQR